MEGLDEHALAALPWLWDFWALDHQRPPPGDWRAWVILGGRGAGKTRAGAEWVRSMVEGPRRTDPGRARRVALVGETLDQAREVMVMGDSGILACCPPDRRPDWIATRRLLRWPNGAEAQLFSAHDPESLRGPQFDAAWVDELAKWPKVEEAWAMLQFTLRLGRAPRVCVTTTPRRGRTLRKILDRDTTVQTHAPTEANAANLAPSYISELRAAYPGARAKQELDGLFLPDIERALWPARRLEEAVVRQVPPLDRIVVGVDPAVSARHGKDEVGIVVVGATCHGDPKDWRAWVLEDASVPNTGSEAWARAAVAAWTRHRAGRIVAEVNQGGDLVRHAIHQVDPGVPVRMATATRGKADRALPVSALYEQGRVSHLGTFPKLEDQMAEFSETGFHGSGSPDRVDALVWAVTDLLLERRGDGPPRVSRL
ncbi:DNA-packaging protein [Histidinibacterium aquaticum]|uniref:DNA-packaging protein n=1 Tax=Histidinibacterium aquaticum TaxID=2613962 RepID=A0A5J5GM21_9RHOB|nr:terminase family protein [Histidinibacterium aquaticum]KAA9009245.1 DNA-packaging protein [Histidinibacterium aquaticum]